jgi:hypothetical protein
MLAWGKAGLCGCVSARCDRGFAAVCTHGRSVVEADAAVAATTCHEAAGFLLALLSELSWKGALHRGGHAVRRGATW